MSVEVAKHGEGAVEPFPEDDTVRVASCVNTCFGEGEQWLGDVYVAVFIRVGWFVEFDEEVQ